MTRNVYLYGKAGRLFGRRFKLSVASPAEAFRALFMLRPGLKEFVRDGAWRIIVGRPHIANAIPPTAYGMAMGGQDLHIVPATNPAGGNNSAIGKIVVGVVLIGATIITAGAAGAAFAGAAAAAEGASAAAAGFTAFSTAMGATAFMGISYGSIALMGVSMVLTGLSGLLAGSPNGASGPVEPTSQARAGDTPSFMFNGVTNNSQQGGPIPLVFGEHLTGSVVVNGGIAVEDIAV